MLGVKVGNGVIIASNSVVTKNIDDYSIVGGNPATLIRKRFDDEIKFLNEIAWWNWNIEKITEYSEVIAHGSISDMKKIFCI